jgi:hypothetical protein
MWSLPSISNTILYQFTLHDVLNECLPPLTEGCIYKSITKYMFVTFIRDLKKFLLQ